MQSNAYAGHQIGRRAGLTFQIFWQYSRIDRSEENFPMRAIFRIDIFVQRERSRKVSETILLAINIRTKILQDKIRIMIQQGINRGLNKFLSPLGKFTGLKTINDFPEIFIVMIKIYRTVTCFDQVAESLQLSARIRKSFPFPTASMISIFAPSMVPMVRAPFMANFIFPVPEASFPAVEICSERSADR